MDAIKKKRPFIKAWFALSEIIELYEADKPNWSQDDLNERADIIAAFRTIEKGLGIDQTIPVKIRTRHPRV